MKATEFKVTKEEDGVTIQALLASRLKISRKKAKDVLDSKHVFVDGRRVWMARHTLHHRQTVSASLPDKPSGTEKRIALLFEDDHYLVADKPAGLLSNGPDSLESRLQTQHASPAWRAVHRLDRDTSGCLLFAKSDEAFSAAVELFRARDLTKTYHAIVTGHMEGGEQTISRPLDGKPARTDLKVLDSSRDASHLMVRIGTGRTHQIRRHLVAIHHPVLGDMDYATRDPQTQKGMKVPRQMLHAATLAFRQPVTQRHVTVQAPLPSDFRRCLRTFGLT